MPSVIHLKPVLCFRRNKLDLLVALYIFCICAAEMMGSKTFPLAVIGPFQLRPTVSIFLFPLIFTINDIITEVYGKERTRSIIRSGLMVIALIFGFSIFAVALPPSNLFEQTEPAYDQIFSISARVSAASLVAFAPAAVRQKPALVAEQSVELRFAVHRHSHLYDPGFLRLRSIPGGQRRYACQSDYSLLAAEVFYAGD